MIIVKRNAAKALSLCATSYLALFLGVSETSYAQSSLPAVTVDAPTKPKARRTATKRTTAVAARTARRAAQPQQTTAPQRVTRSTGMVGNLPAPYAGGQVATGAQLGVLGNRSVFDAPFNITSYTSKTIENQQARSIGDVLQNDPSVRLGSNQANGSEVFVIRGFNVPNGNVAYNGLYGITPYWKGSVAAVERVEVLKGPSALLNGMAPGGAVGGTINIVPKRAGDEPLTRVIGGYQSDTNFGGQIDTGQRFGDDKEFGVRFNGVYRDGETFRNSSQRQGEAVLALDYRGERARFSVDMGYLDLAIRGTEGLMAATTVIPNPPNASNAVFQPWSYYNSQTLYGVARGEVDLTENVTAYAAVGGRDYKDQYVLPFTVNLAPNGNFTEGFARSNEYWNALSAETGLRSKFDTGFVTHQVNLGATSLTQTNGLLSSAIPSVASNLYTPNFVAAPVLPTLGALPKVGEVDLKGVALTDTMSVLNERLQFTLGARYQNVVAQNFNATTGAITSNYNAETVTPAFAILIKPVDKLSFYANYIEGLTQGGIAPSGTKNAGQVFAPAISKQAEGGVKVDLGTIGTTFSFFEITQPSAYTDTASNTFVMDGQQRHRGMEFNVFGEVTAGVRALGGVTLLDPVLVNTLNHTADGNAPVNVPRTSVNLGFEWDTPFARGLTLTGRGVYTGSVYTNQANTLSIPDWTRYDVGARYVFQRLGGKPITLIANVVNVFDKTYWSSASLYRAAPRTYMLSTVFDF